MRDAAWPLAPAAFDSKRKTSVALRKLSASVAKKGAVESKEAGAPRRGNPLVVVHYFSDVSNFEQRVDIASRHYGSD